MRFPFFLSLGLLCFGTIQGAAQELLFQSDLSTDAGFSVLAGTDNAFEFGYDFGDVDGIPEAPNSELLDGEPSLGLKLEANLTRNELSELAVVTKDLELSGRFSVQVDLWLNYNIPDGTTGTTEFGGLSIGHDGVTPGRSGATFLYNTDGDSSLDYRMYRNTDFVPADSGSYAVDSLDNTSEPFVSAFPPIDVNAAVPKQFVLGNTNAGSGGFRWMVVEAIVDTDLIGQGGTLDPGVATFSLTDAETGNEVTIGTIDNSSAQAAIDLKGNVGLVFADLFSSLSPSPDLSFGVFDNLIITQMEPLLDPLDCNADGMLNADDLKCTELLDDLDDLLTELNLLEGDFNGDGSVNFPDFLILSLNFSKQVDNYTEGDVNLDGVISFPDFLKLSLNFGQSSQPVAVPEPAAMSLLALAMGCLLVHRREWTMNGTWRGSHSRKSAFISGTQPVINNR